MESLLEIGTSNTANQDELIAQLRAENARLLREVEVLRQERKVYPPLEKRRAGILLHISSLPGTVGHGDLGDNAYYFIDFLKECGLSVWQMLPVHPLYAPMMDLSPFQPLSVHAGNPLFISLEWLIRKGWLREEVIPTFDNLQKAIPYRYSRLKQAYARFENHKSNSDYNKYEEFANHNAEWLNDYALFCALKDKYENKAWWEWDTLSREHNSHALQEAKKELKHLYEQHRFEQFVFFEQWKELKKYANEQGIYLFGNMPFFVAEDSVEVWANRKLFLLNDQGRTAFHAGTPYGGNYLPYEIDSYSHLKEENWGNPLYNWEPIKSDKFQWWIKRFRKLYELFDLVLLGNSRSFWRCWAIPVRQDAGKKSDWLDSPGKDLFETLFSEGLGRGRLVADAVGYLEEVDSEWSKLNIYVIKILQLAFEWQASRHEKENTTKKVFPYTPLNIREESVVYTGTHDTDTTRGWFENLGENQKIWIRNKFPTVKTSKDMPWSFIEYAFASQAKLAIVPMQDILAADSKQRMNIPGTSQGDWEWQFKWSQVSVVADKLTLLVEESEREEKSERNI